MTEVCGLLFGAGDEVSEARRCTNIAPDPAASFEIDPIALITAHKAERAGGARMMGCYHSHPNGVLALSARDKANAVAGQIWVVVADGTIGAWVV